MVKMCRHCGTKRGYTRGLCAGCFATPAILALYPPRRAGRKPGCRASKKADEKTVCWGCEKPQPRRSKRVKGWKVRRFWFQSARLVECLCPVCFARHGWPVVYKAKRLKVPAWDDGPRVYHCAEVA